MIEYRKENIEKIKQKKKEWRDNNKERIKKQNQKYVKKNPEKVKMWKEAEKLRRKINGYNKIPKVKKSKLKWRRKNKGYSKNYYEENKQRLLKQSQIYEKTKIRTDKEFAIQKRLRRLLRTALKVYTRTGKLYNSKQYGIDYGLIIKHLKPFPEDLSKYHIDHIRPLCSFKFINMDGSQNLEAIKEAFKPENHRWLLGKENLLKSAQEKKMKGEYE